MPKMTETDPPVECDPRYNPYRGGIVTDFGVFADDRAFRTWFAHEFGRILPVRGLRTHG